MKVMFAFFAVVAVLLWIGIGRLFRKADTGIIRVGEPLPTFAAVTEAGEPVSSDSLAGQRAVLLFVRGSWCPFCNQQVEALTEHYRSIAENGGRLIIVTPKPLDTTRRVADVFGVDFDFWLDEDHKAARVLGLYDPEPIPESLQKDYGQNTLRPAVAVIDSQGVVKYAYRSVDPTDRPDPARFMTIFRAAS